MNDTPTIVTVIVAVAGILSWVLQKVIGYYIESDRKKQAYIEQLVSQNQKNSDGFLNAVNHQQTLNREQQERTAKAIEDLTRTLVVNNTINEKLIGYMSERK